MRFPILLLAFVLFQAGCDSAEPSDEGAAVSATLFEHHYQGRDSVVVADFSGSAMPVSLDSAWTAEGLEPAGGYSISTVTPYVGDPFVFIVETCEGSENVTAIVTLPDDEAEPVQIGNTRDAAWANARAGGPCTMRVFAIRDFGDPPNVTIRIVRNETAYEVDVAEHTVTGTPAIAATGDDFSFRSGPDDVLSSHLSAGEPAEGVLPLEVYRLNDGFEYWQARAGDGGYLGAVRSGEPTDGVRYYVFILGIDTGTWASPRAPNPRLHPTKHSTVLLRSTPSAYVAPFTRRLAFRG